MANQIDNRNFAILEYIYHHPYITFSELSDVFPDVVGLDRTVTSFESNKYIELRKAADAASDKGYVTVSFSPDSHLVTLPTGNIIIEDAYRHDNEFREIIDKMQQRIDEAHDASKTAKRQSWASFIVALISLVVAILA